jgi:hypothetical protein
LSIISPLQTCERTQLGVAPRLNLKEYIGKLYSNQKWFGWACFMNACESFVVAGDNAAFSVSVLDDKWPNT